MKASLGEVATALQALTRERHPLADQPLSVIGDVDVHPLQMMGEEASCTR